MAELSYEPYHFFLIIIYLISYFMNYMCEILEDEKKPYQNRSSTCSSDQFAYK
jgi:hypothetical protein